MGQKKPMTKSQLTKWLGSTILLGVTLTLIFFAIRPTDYSKANEGEDFEDVW